MKIVGKLPLPLALVLTVLLVAGCVLNMKGPPPEALIIAFSGDTKAELYKCGCRSKQIGGIGRRGTAIDQMGPAPKLVIDCGNFSSTNTSEFNRLKVEALLDAYEVIGYDAVNVGNYEIIQGREFIEKANELFNGKLISANVVSADGTPIVQPFITKDYGSLRVGIIGLTYHQTQLVSPRRTEKAPVITRDPIEALEEYLPIMRNKEKCDLIVVAGILQQKDIEDIAENFDGQIDVILSGYGFDMKEKTGEYAHYYVKPEDSETPEGSQPVIARDEANKRETGIILHKTGQAGKYIGKLYAPVIRDEEGDFAFGQFEGSTLEMDEEFPDSPVVQGILDKFHAYLQEHRSEHLEQLVSQPALYYWMDYPMYIGSRTCSECHREQSNHWNTSLHARSMQSLNQGTESDNPDCVKCHVTAYGEPEGYVDRTVTWYLTNVGCEVCHGPAREHIGIEFELKEARAMNSRKKATEEQLALLESIKAGYDHKITRTVTEELCLKCHNEEWSPDFNYEEYLSIVDHSNVVPITPEGGTPPGPSDGEISVQLPPNPGGEIPQVDE